MTPILTERLTIRPVTLEDAEFIFAVTNDADFKKYIGDRGVHDIPSAIGYIENGPLESYRKFGFGLLIVELTETAVPIGTCGLLQRDYLDCPDIGFAFMPAFRKSGFAYEASKAVIQDAQERLGVTKVAGLVSPENVASSKLLEKLGLKYAKQQHIDSQPLTHIYFNCVD